MENCLANTGISVYGIAAVGLVIIVAGLAAALIARRGGRKIWFMSMVLVAAGLCGVGLQGQQTYAAVGSNESCVATNPSTPTTLIASTPGATNGAAGDVQSFNALTNATPSSGATLIANSLRLALPANPVAGSTLSPDEMTVTVPDEGVYEAQADGTITFTPEPSFSGTAQGVRFTLRDTAGQTTTNTYTPSVAAPLCVDVRFSESASMGIVDFEGSWIQTTAELPLLDYAYYADSDDAFLGAEDAAEFIAGIDIDPSTPGVQTTVDHTADQGWTASYNPATGMVTLNVSNPPLYLSEATPVGLPFVFVGGPSLCSLNAVIQLGVSTLG